MAQILKVFFAGFTIVSVAQGVRIKNWPVKALGQVTCDGQAMPYVFVELMDKDPTVDTEMGRSRTNVHGEFKVNGSGRDWFRGKPDPYIRVSYSYSGHCGRMKVVGAYKKVRNGKSRVKPYNENINFGTINFANIHCRAYMQFYKALEHFKKKARTLLPYRVLYVRTKAPLHGGTPYSTTNIVRIPGKYKTISYATAKHEFAHTIRHTYDGSLAHFLGDAAKYKYTQHHHCGKKTNYGFAFNEGWAAYWEGACHGKYGGNSKSGYYKYEGNVAKALRKLQKKCKSTLYRMVRVLRLSKKKIHSFKKYNNRHKDLYGCKI